MTSLRWKRVLLYLRVVYLWPESRSARYSMTSRCCAKSCYIHIAMWAMALSFSSERLDMVEPKAPPPSEKQASVDTPGWHSLSASSFKITETVLGENYFCPMSWEMPQNDSGFAILPPAMWVLTALFNSQLHHPHVWELLIVVNELSSVPPQQKTSRCLITLLVYRKVRGEMKPDVWNCQLNETHRQSKQISALEVDLDCSSSSSDPSGSRTHPGFQPTI